MKNEFKKSLEDMQNLILDMNKKYHIEQDDFVQMLLIITVSVPISFVRQMLPAEMTEQVGFTKLLKPKDLTNVNILNF